VTKPAWVLIAFIVAVSYVVSFLLLQNLPFTDAPNHVARAAIMTSLWTDPKSPFIGMYLVRHVFMPYMLPDLLLAALLRIGLGYSVWPALTMAAFAASILYYAWQLLSAWWTRVAAALLAWYFATNYLFVLGFFAFEWGLVASFFALGALEAGWIVLYVAACVVCYGSHLAALAILAAIVGTRGAFRAVRKQQTWARWLWELVPFGLLGAYHFLFVPSHPEAAGGTVAHNTIGDKLGHFLEAMFVRQNYAIDRSILALFFAIIACSIWFAGKTRFRRQWELLVVCGIAAAIYFILPFGVGAIYYIDERALPFFYVPLAVLSLKMLEDAKFGRIQVLLGACALLVAANFASLASFLPRQNRDLGAYREALRAVPARKLVLTVNTRQKDGNTWPMRHAGSFYATDREGYAPYLFNARSFGGPSGYFVDLTSIYQPPPNWYTDSFTPDWEQIERTYDYLVVTKPWEDGRIDRKLSIVYENDVATVFRVR